MATIKTNYFRAEYTTSTSTNLNVSFSAKYAKATKEVAKPTLPPAPTDSNAHRRSVVLAYYRRGPSTVEGRHGAEKQYCEISCVNIQELLAKFFLQVQFQKEPIPNWREHCIGITSLAYTRDGRTQGHMPLLEYDGKNIKRLVQEDIREVQGKFGLGPAWVYKTYHGYHVYFGSDVITDQGAYLALLEATKCDPKFVECVRQEHLACIRVSAKYTEFDIEPESVIVGPNTKEPRRKLREMILAEQLINLGAECKTHFASLYPKWASYAEDLEPWKPRARKAKATTAAEAVNPEPPMAKINWVGPDPVNIFLENLVSEPSPPGQNTVDWVEKKGSILENAVQKGVISKDQALLSFNRILKASFPFPQDCGKIWINFFRALDQPPAHKFVHKLTV